MSVNYPPPQPNQKRDFNENPFLSGNRPDQTASLGDSVPQQGGYGQGVDPNDPNSIISKYQAIGSI